MADTVSVLTGGVNSFQTTAEHLNNLATDTLADGVIGAITSTSGVAPMTGALAVNAQGSPNMTVAVTGGVCYVTATPTSQASQRLRAKIATQNATIASNSTGGTRFDWIYVTISAANAAAPNAAGDNVASITVSRSTSSSVDNGTPPTYGYHIATVTVVNGASSIANASIADTRTETSAKVVIGQIADGIITNAKLAANTAWTSYTPTFTNVTVGNGTLVAKYQQIGKTVRARISLVFGSTTAVSGDIQFTLPVTAASYAGTANVTQIGVGQMYDVSAVRVYQGTVSMNTTTAAVLRAQAADLSFLYFFLCSSTVPFTWATGDEIGLTFTYEAA